jgi:hypothetical protein
MSLKEIWEKTKLAIRNAVIDTITDPKNIPYFIVILIWVIVGIWVILFSASRDLIYYPLK